MSKKSRKTTSTKTPEPEQAPESTPQLTPEQKEFLDAMNNLIMSAQELS